MVLRRTKTQKLNNEKSKPNWKMSVRSKIEDAKKFWNTTQKEYFHRASVAGMCVIFLVGLSYTTSNAGWWYWHLTSEEQEREGRGSLSLLSFVSQTKTDWSEIYGKIMGWCDGREGGRRGFSSMNKKREGRQVVLNDFFFRACHEGRL